jgi:hypothetical protein
MNFSLANRWDCILLLDEADVFLAERTKEDFKRNGLVAGQSIFMYTRLPNNNPLYQSFSASWSTMPAFSF